MPIYEYRCSDCGRTTEALQRLDDPPLTTCAECGGALKKLISAPAFQFKGSGWYVTDYARKGGGGSEKAEKGEKGEKEEGKAKEAKGGKDDGGATKPASDGGKSEASSSAGSAAKGDRVTV